MNKKSMKSIIVKSLLFISGLVLGALLFNDDNSLHEEHRTMSEDLSQENNIKWWTCSMHLQIKQDEAGKCPICGMQLIPVKRTSKTSSFEQIEMTDKAIKLASIMTSTVKYSKAEKKIYLEGKIEADERKIISQSAHISGRIEKLFIAYKGEKVSKGQKLATIYSPQLVIAQEELFEAMKDKDRYPKLFETVRNKLKLWKLTDKQIERIIEKGKVMEYFDVVADVSGYVTQKNINTGDYIKEGDILFYITDLSHLWVIFDGYEKDLPFIKLNDKIEFSINSIPSKKFISKINYIDPIIDPLKRTTAIRTEIDNKNNLLKPKMFVNGKLTSNLSYRDQFIVVPKSAILWTGKRSIVYTKLPNTKEPIFEIREVELGESLGNEYVINKGLIAGEEIVTNGAFTIDAAAQLNNQKNMMNRR